MILYGHHESGHSYKIRTFLLMANIPHEYRWIDLTLSRKQRPVEFQTASKFDEVPVLIDEKSTLCQSNSILMHLAQKHHTLCGAPNEWHAVTEWLSWEANRIGFSLPNLRFNMRWNPQPEAIMAYLRERVLNDLKILDRFLKDTEYLAPSGLTIADISCSAYLFWLNQVDLDVADYPNIQRWLLKIQTTPGWQSPEMAMKQKDSKTQPNS